MKASFIIAALVSLAAAANPLAARADCSCDISKCPTSGAAVRLPPHFSHKSQTNPPPVLCLHHRPHGRLLRRADQRRRRLRQARLPRTSPFPI